MVTAFLIAQTAVSLTVTDVQQDTLYVVWQDSVVVTTLEVDSTRVLHVEFDALPGSEILIQPWHWEPDSLCIVELEYPQSWAGDSVVVEAVSWETAGGDPNDPDWFAGPPIFITTRHVSPDSKVEITPYCDDRMDGLLIRSWRKPVDQDPYKNSGKLELVEPLNIP